MSNETQAAVLAERDAAEEARLVDVLRPYQLAKLEKYRWKGGWQGDDPLTLFERAYMELNEMYDALTAGAPAEEIASECADVANFVAMIADVVLERGKRG